jgi:pimeloyl-ACP methyl ester carboxylesterase
VTTRGRSLVSADGRRLQFWDGGARDGFPVMFLHGCPDCRLQAVPGAAAAMSVGVRLIALNRPGYGRSDGHASTHASVAGDVTALADRLECERFAVLGMSVGGPYALACAATQGSRVTAVGVVGAPADPADCPAGSGTVADRAARAGSDDAAMELFRPDFARWLQELAVAASTDLDLVDRLVTGMHPLDAAVIRSLPAEHVAAELREAVASDLGYLRDAAVTFRPWRFDVRHIRVRSHFWYGEHDPNVEISARWVARRLPEARLQILPGTAHLGALQQHWTEILTTLRDSSTTPPGTS